MFIKFFFKAKNGKIDNLVGRNKELERITQILNRRQKNNPCLIGEPGVGKTAIVEGLAARINLGLVPDHMQGKRLLNLDLSGMVAGSKYRGEFEERLKKIMDEIRQAGNVILVIDEMHTLYTYDNFFEDIKVGSTLRGNDPKLFYNLFVNPKRKDHLPNLLLILEFLPLILIFLHFFVFQLM